MSDLSLPLDILILILERFNFNESLRFRIICKEWKLIIGKKKNFKFIRTCPERLFKILYLFSDIESIEGELSLPWSHRDMFTLCKIKRATLVIHAENIDEVNNIMSCFHPDIEHLAIVFIMSVVDYFSESYNREEEVISIVLGRMDDRLAIKELEMKALEDADCYKFLENLHEALKIDRSYSLEYIFPDLIHDISACSHCFQDRYEQSCISIVRLQSLLIHRPETKMKVKTLTLVGNQLNEKLRKFLIGCDIQLIFL